MAAHKLFKIEFSSIDHEEKVRSINKLKVVIFSSSKIFFSSLSIYE